MFSLSTGSRKIFESILLRKTGIIHEGHNLLKLCKKAIEFEPSLKEFIKDVSFINMFYIEVRYPPDEPMYVSEEDTIECLEATKKILKKIEEALGFQN